ncbi:MAG: M20 family metallopeptidase, partial [Actinomycetota bacterium]
IIDFKREEIINFTLECVKNISETPPGDETSIAECFIEKSNKWLLDPPKILSKKEKRPNLIFNIKGSRKGRKLIFSGHMDTKPIGDAASWKAINPATPQVIEGKLYGRGSTDMKGGLVGMLAAAHAITASNIALNGDLFLLFTSDEEGGCNYGAKFIVKKGLEADAIVVGEPSGENKDFDSIGLASRGAMLAKVVVHGTQMHSSISDRGGCINASVEMAKVMVEFANNLKKRIHYTDHKLYPLGPTINPGVTLDGGIFYGVIPGTASFGFDIRTMPGMTFENLKNDIEEFLVYLKGKNKNLRAELIVEKPPLNEWVPPAEIKYDHPIVESCIVSAKKILNYEPKKIGVPFATEAGYFDNYLNIPTISAFGPGLIKLAHGPDEYIDVQSIIDSAKIYALTALDFLNK